MAQLQQFSALSTEWVYGFRVVLMINRINGIAQFIGSIELYYILLLFIVQYYIFM